MRVIERSWRAVEMLVEEEPKSCSVCGTTVLEVSHNFNSKSLGGDYSVSCEWYKCPQSPTSYGATLPEAITNWNEEWGQK